MLPIVAGSPAPLIIEMGEPALPFDIWHSRSDIVLSINCCNKSLSDSSKQFLLEQLTIQFENWPKRAYVWAWWITLLKRGDRKRLMRL